MNAHRPIGPSADTTIVCISESADAPRAPSRSDYPVVREG
jgi:hypothetical protein